MRILQGKDPLVCGRGDILRYIANEYGPRALIRALKGGKIPRINEKKFIEFVTAESGTVDIGETILTLNISLEERKFKAVVNYNNVTSQPHIFFRRTPRINLEEIKVNGENVDFVQDITLVIPLKDFKNGSIEIKYTGDYSKIEKITTSNGICRGTDTQI